MNSREHLVSRLEAPYGKQKKENCNNLSSLLILKQLETQEHERRVISLENKHSRAGNYKQNRKALRIWNNKQMNSRQRGKAGTQNKNK